MTAIESRGGHAWGWATPNNWYKSTGKVPTITSQLHLPNDNPQIMIMHTRWATHGNSNDVNCAHPFVSGKWAIVHNGIVDNEHQAQKTKCDSEAILKLLIEKDDIKAVAEQLIGMFRIAIINKETGHLIIVNDSSPVWFGKRFNSEIWFASESKQLPTDCWMKEGKSNTITELWIEDKNIKSKTEHFNKKTKYYTPDFAHIPQHPAVQKGWYNFSACRDCDERTCYKCPLVNGNQ